MTFWTVLSSILAVVVSLALVLGLAFVALKGIRRWQDRFPGADEGGERPMRFLRALPVGQSERLTMVEVRGEVLLLGVTAGGISLIKSWPATAVTPAERGEA